MRACSLSPRVISDRNRCLYVRARVFVNMRCYMYKSICRGPSLDNEQQHVAKSKRKILVADYIRRCTATDIIMGRFRPLLCCFSINSIVYRSCHVSLHRYFVKKIRSELLIISTIKMDKNYKSYKRKVLTLCSLFFFL